ncbi:MAG: CTP synthase, partial [candidate division WOR-3 bacterium]
QFALEVGKENVLFIHLTLIPYIKASCEFKTKPTQHSVNKLREIGIQPDIIMCRTERPLPPEAKEKIALFCSVRKEAVIEAIDVDNIYQIPLVFHEQKLDELIAVMLGICKRRPDLNAWRRFVESQTTACESLEIGLCGKYVALRDAYKSVVEAVAHAAAANSLMVKIRWIEAEDVKPGTAHEWLAGLGGVIVPGGFGVRGMEGKIETITYCREKGMPFLGLCVGLQVAVIEFARVACGLSGANSTEFNPRTPHPVIHLLPQQRGVKRKGGTMRLGAYPCRLSPGTMAYRCYKRKLVWERHRHRYEVNNCYLKTLARKGLIASGRSPDRKLVEIVELKGHPFFIATQFHPEFKSRPLRPHPLFREFIKASHEFARRHSLSGSGAAR